MVSEAIAKGNIQAINYFVANNYVKALEALATAPNQKVLMLPVDAASIIGSIGGIIELTKDVYGPRGDSGSSQRSVPSVPSR
jgi:hypothetical protein